MTGGQTPSGQSRSVRSTRWSPGDAGEGQRRVGGREGLVERHLARRARRAPRRTGTCLNVNRGLSRTPTTSMPRPVSSRDHLLVPGDEPLVRGAGRRRGGHGEDGVGLDVEHVVLGRREPLGAEVRLARVGRLAEGAPALEQGDELPVPLPGHGLERGHPLLGVGVADDDDHLARGALDARLLAAAPGSGPTARTGPRTGGRGSPTAGSSWVASGRVGADGSSAGEVRSAGPGRRGCRRRPADAGGPGGARRCPLPGGRGRRDDGQARGHDGRHPPPARLGPGGAAQRGLHEVGDRGRPRPPRSAMMASPAPRPARGSPTTAR